MPFFVGDYLQDTGGLTSEQHGAYLLILFDLWSHEGALPMDEAYLARITRMTKGRFEKHVWPVLAGYFTIRTDRLGSTLEHGRLSREFEEYARKTLALSNAGKRGFQEKQRKNNGGSQARLKPGHKQPEPEPYKTTAGATPARGALALVHSQDREALEEFAMREAGGGTHGGGDVDR